MIKQRYVAKTQSPNTLKRYKIMPTPKPNIREASPPWGKWEVLLDEPNYKVKRITVLPGKD